MSPHRAEPCVSLCRASTLDGRYVSIVSRLGPDTLYLIVSTGVPEWGVQGGGAPLPQARAAEKNCVLRPPNADFLSKNDSQHVHLGVPENLNFMIFCSTMLLVFINGAHGGNHIDVLPRHHASPPYFILYTLYFVLCTLYLRACSLCLLAMLALSHPLQTNLKRISSCLSSLH